MTVTFVNQHGMSAKRNKGTHVHETVIDKKRFLHSFVYRFKRTYKAAVVWFSLACMIRDVKDI